MEAKSLVGYIGWVFTVVVCVVLYAFHKSSVPVFYPNSQNVKSSPVEEVLTYPPITDITRKLNLETLHLTEAKKGLSKMLSLIRHRYEFDTFTGRQFVLTSNNIDLASWDLIKYRLAYKIATGNQSFFMLFGGSSVTAGHDNFYNQSYPFVVERRLKDIFSILGVELIVHNIAQGANNCIPYILCYESMGGMNPDFIGWEQSYNCGRDNGVFEAAARIVGYNELGGSAYFSASGAWLPKDCPPSPDPIPYCSEDWTPAAANLQDYEFNIDEIRSIKDMLIRSNEGKPSSARFTSHYHNDYKSVATHGFNVWEENPRCTAFDQKKGHNISCNGFTAAQGCTLKFMSVEASYYGGGHGANWHPSAAFHLLRGEFIAWIYGLILYEAIEMVESELTSHKAEELSKKFYHHLHGIPKLPPPKYCNGMNCLHKATCYTDYTPHYPKNMTLSELVVGTHNWHYNDAELGDWSLKFGYKDAKASYSAESKQNGEIHLLAPVGDEGKLWVCGSLASAEFFLEEIPDKEKFNAPSYKPDPNKYQGWEHKRDIGNECKELHGIKPGYYVVGIANTGDKGITLTHVLTWLSKSKWSTLG